ncbi:hypothetical protein ACIA5D_37560 [Actinoplanes sp. NPDC051513]|uniref:hypothetical protein n=1 Tax=Actinoplanes sp. NPDC051513 TaxID=3363908 RepID=UPI0037AB60B8
MTTHKDPVATTEERAATAVSRLPVLASQCSGGTCPTVYGTDRQTVVVQGYVVNGDSAGVEVPEGERLVEIPTEILLAAADKIRNQA